jgi:lambda family phage portal protein
MEARHVDGAAASEHHRVTAPWIDRVVTAISPTWGLKRTRARLATQLMARHFEAATPGRRTENWHRWAGDVNATLGPALEVLRRNARDLVRNNPYAESAVTTIADQCVGWGIVAKPDKTAPAFARSQAERAWKSWADSTACDADGRSDFYGLQKLVMRGVVESGEALVRRRWRRAEDGFPLPMQLQILEPDFLDTLKEAKLTTRDGRDAGRIVHGVEFNPIGQRTAYWLFPEHPGGRVLSTRSFSNSVRVPASEVLHVYKPSRAGQVRAPTWFANVILRLKDFDEYEDATLMKQKIAACLAVFVTDMDGSATPLGATDATKPEVDALFPGMVGHLAAGRQVTAIDPPSVSEHGPYAETQLRAIATGLGIAYEDLTGNYSGMPFSAARMSRLRHWARVEDWRWRMLIPQFCDPVWRWAMEAAAIMGLENAPTAEWTAPPAPMIDPAAEGLAYQQIIRIGGMTWDEMVRERGYDPEDQLAEIVARNKKWDAAGVTFDCDPRKTSQQGQPTDTKTAAPAAASNGNGTS